MKAQNPNQKAAAFFQKQHLATLLLGALLLLGLAALGGLRLYARHLTAAAVGTPIPPPPHLPDSVESEPGLKSDAYYQELREGDQQSSERTEDELRWNRITMSWDEVYEQAKEDPHKARAPEEEEVPAKTLAPQKPRPPTKARSYRQRSLPVKAKEKPASAKPAKSPVFNLQLQESTKASAEVESGSARRLQFVRAIIAGEFKVRAGETVTLQLLEAVKLNGQEVPALSLLSGLVSMGNGRVNIEVQHLQLGESVIPVQWQCYDQHMVKGLPYDGSTSRTEDRVQQRLARRAEQDIQRNLPRIPYVSDAAEGIIDAAQGIRWNKRGKVSLPNNYEVLLKIN